MPRFSHCPETTVLRNIDHSDSNECRRFTHCIRCRFVVWLLVSLLTIGCQPAALVNQLTPRGAFELHQDIPYGPDPRQTFDLYVPVSGTMEPETVVFVYGGGWQSGSKDDYLFVGQAFTELGYVTVVPDYRLYPQVTFPDFVDDLASAIATLNEVRAIRRCTDGLRVVIVGHSAGAHTAALLATDPQYLRRSGAHVDLHALVALAGPYDLPLGHRNVRGKFDRVRDDREANPVSLATGETPPVLLLHGTDDSTVSPTHTAKFAAKLNAVGVPVTVHNYDGANHVSLVGALATPVRFLHPVHKDIASFLADLRSEGSCG